MTLKRLFVLMTIASVLLVVFQRPLIALAELPFTAINWDTFVAHFAFFHNDLLYLVGLDEWIHEPKPSRLDFSGKVGLFVGGASSILIHAVILALSCGFVELGLKWSAKPTKEGPQ